MNLWAEQAARTDAVATDGCKTSASVVETAGTQPQPCAACQQPTLKARPACWVCIGKAQGFAGQMDDAALGQEDTARIEAGRRHSNLFIAGLLAANPDKDFRDVLDLIVMKEVG